MKNDTKPTPARQETVSEAARDLHTRYQKTGTYNAQKLQHVFGDPRKGVVGRVSDHRCAAVLRK